MCSGVYNEWIQFTDLIHYISQLFIKVKILMNDNETFIVACWTEYSVFRNKNQQEKIVLLWQ